MRRKIIRGEIEVIDVLINEIDLKFYSGKAELVKYNVKLKNDNTVYQTYTSLKGVQIGDTIDIFYDKKGKEENAILLNKKTAGIILKEYKVCQSFYYSLIILSFIQILSKINEIIYNKEDIIAGVFLIILALLLPFLAKHIFLGNFKFKKQDIVLLKKYKKGKILNDVDISISDIKNVKEKEKTMV